MDETMNDDACWHTEGEYKQNNPQGTPPTPTSRQNH